MSLILAAGNGGGSILAFNSGFAIWVLITLIIFLAVMGKYVVPVIMNSLSEREDRIKESLESAENALAKADKISKENKQALREAELKAKEIRKQAVEDAELLREERIEKAKQDADEMIEQAKQSIEQEKKRALNELREEVSELAIKASSIILDAEIDKQKNKKLVDNFIKDVTVN